MRVLVQEHATREVRVQWQLLVLLSGCPCCVVVVVHIAVVKHARVVVVKRDIHVQNHH